MSPGDLAIWRNANAALLRSSLFARARYEFARQEAEGLPLHLYNELVDAAGERYDHELARPERDYTRAIRRMKAWRTR